MNLPFMYPGKSHTSLSDTYNTFYSSWMLYKKQIITIFKQMSAAVLL